MQNINYVGGAGSTTAAQFLKRFILKDTLGSFRYSRNGFSKYGGALNSGGATGYGVRLNKFVGIVGNITNTINYKTWCSWKNLVENKKFKEMVYDS